MTIFYKIIFAIALTFGVDLFAKGQPTEWQMGFQDAASPLMAELSGLHDFIFWIITFITIFVFVLLAYVCFKFSAKRNKTPSQTTHNSLLEVAWTVIPVLILTSLACIMVNVRSYVVQDMALCQFPLKQ